MRKPDFFIVGAPRCGTTAFNEYLKKHPEVFIPNKKELHYFGSDLEFRKKRLSLEKYLSYFTAVDDEKRVGEASVWYLYSKNAAEEIKEFNPRASIIIMLRNPIDMLYSLHSRNLYTGDEQIECFRAALAAEEERKRGRRLPETTRNLSALRYREVAKFTEQVSRYLDVFGKDNVRIIIFDDFRENTERVYRETCDFLGVNPDFTPTFRNINPNKQVRSKRMWHFMLHPPEPVRHVFRSLVPVSIRSKAYKGIRMLNTRYQKRPPLDSHLREQLKKEFSSEVERLSALLDRDLTHWCA